MAGPKKKAQQPTPAPAPAPAENRKKLLRNLTIHRRIVEAGQVLLLGLAFWYAIIPSFWALKDSILFKVAGQALFGTATSSGIPVTIAKSLLPAFMAPYAAYMILALPVLIWGYQLGFNYINKDLFTPKAPTTPAPPPAPGSQPAPANSANNRQTPENPAPDAQPSNKKAPAKTTAAAKKATQQAANKSAQPKEALTKPGKGPAITHGLNKHRAASNKREAANAKKRQDAQAKKLATDKAPAKRGRASHR